MFFRALAAFIVLPGIAAIIVPLLIAYFDPWSGGTWLPGLFLLCLGALVLIWCVRDFYVSGRGTLAPWDPPMELVVVGLYRFVRNPMYFGVLLLVLGWSVYFCSPLLVLYEVILATGFHIRVVVNEEPWLKKKFSRQWELYQQEVPRWLPRVRPWKGHR
jgi:protein-S-isoprenylcysteine O-methyltransferase Ste14